MFPCKLAAGLSGILLVNDIKQQKDDIELPVSYTIVLFSDNSLLY